MGCCAVTFNDGGRGKTAASAPARQPNTPRRQTAPPAPAAHLQQQPPSVLPQPVVPVDRQHRRRGHVRRAALDGRVDRGALGAGALEGAGAVDGGAQVAAAAQHRVDVAVVARVLARLVLPLEDLLGGGIVMVVVVVVVRWFGRSWEC
jgi:hypothetical protein